MLEVVSSRMLKVHRSGGVSEWFDELEMIVGTSQSQKHPGRILHTNRLYSHRLHLRLVSEESRLHAAEESSITIIGKEGTKKRKEHRSCGILPVMLLL